MDVTNNSKMENKILKNNHPKGQENGEKERAKRKQQHDRLKIIRKLH